MRRRRRSWQREEDRGCRRSRSQGSWPNLKEVWGGEAGERVLHTGNTLSVNGSAELIRFLWFQEHVGVILCIWVEQV